VGADRSAGARHDVDGFGHAASLAQARGASKPANLGLESGMRSLALGLIVAALIGSLAFGCGQSEGETPGNGGEAGQSTSGGSNAAGGTAAGKAGASSAGTASSGGSS